jgi:hypothetical protein
MLTIKFRIILVGILTLTSTVFQPAARGDVFTLWSGTDRLQTIATGTMFLGQSWQGVPLVPWGTAYDTLMYRDGNISISPGGNATIGLQMQALQLRSVAPFDPSGSGLLPVDYYYVTLNGSSQPMGSMTLYLDAAAGPGNWFGTVDTRFTVNFEVRASDGSVIPLADSDCYFETLGIPWYWNDPAAGWAEGVTFFENGRWQTSYDSTHEAIMVPEPGSFALTALVTLLFAGRRAWHRRAAR